MPYRRVATYGSDKPDLRCGMEMATVAGVHRDRFRSVSRCDGRRRRCARVRRLERGEILAPRLDGLAEQARPFGATGLVWAASRNRWSEPGAQGGGEAAIRQALDTAGAGPATCC
jgi:aspartyl-tRNA synthetase